MELVSAPTLEELVRTRGPLPPEWAARLGLSLLDTLEAAHKAGIVRRDLKPRNVMVRENGATKLADFGIASVQGDPRLTATGLVVGSPAYMAPEQVEAQAVSPATDLWALGATLWFAVEGQAPFGGGEFQTLSAIVSGQPRRPERLGPLAPVLARLLVKEPEGRATPAQLRPLLRRVVAGGVARPTRPREIRPAAAAWAGATVVVAGRGGPAGPGGPDAGTAGTVLGGTAAEGAERGSVASGDTPPVPGRVRWREGDGAPGTGRRAAGAGEAAPVPPVPMPESRCSPAPAAAGPESRWCSPPWPWSCSAPSSGRASPGTPTSGARRPRPGGRPCPPPGASSRTRTAPTGCRSRPPGRRGTGGLHRLHRAGRGALLPGPADQRRPAAPVRPAEPGAVVRRQASRRRLPPAAGRDHLPERAGGRVEFTFLDEGRLMRGYDITFVASGRRHAILFQAPASRWAASRTSSRPSWPASAPANRRWGRCGRRRRDPGPSPPGPRPGPGARPRSGPRRGGRARSGAAASRRRRPRRRRRRPRRRLRPRWRS